MIPYDVPMIVALLRRMSGERLAAVGPSDFQRWPVQHVTPAKVIATLIDHERATRR